MRPKRSLPLLLLLPLWLGSTPAHAAPDPQPMPTPVPNPYDARPKGDNPPDAGAQPGVTPRKPPPPRPPTRPPVRRQASDSENPVTQPKAPLPLRYRHRRTARGGSSLRGLLVAQSRARLKSLKNGRGWGIGLTVSGAVLVLAGGLSVFTPPGFIIMVTLVPIGGLAMLSGIPLWATMQAMINAERAAFKRLRRYRFQPDSTGPLIASTGAAPHRQLSSVLQLRF